MFGLRSICIESAFFTTYEKRVYTRTLEVVNSETIEPILPPQYRMLAYFLPALFSFLINTARLIYTCENIGSYLLRYPQFLMFPCFTPFMFEGDKQNKNSNKYPLKIWKIGTVVNGFCIGCLPQIILVSMEYYRGVPSWDFGTSKLEFEYNEALIKEQYGNTILAISSCSFFFILILMFFLNYDVLRHQEIKCENPWTSCAYNCIKYSVVDEVESNLILDVVRDGEVGNNEQPIEGENNLKNDEYNENKNTSIQGRHPSIQGSIQDMMDILQTK